MARDTIIGLALGLLIVATVAGLYAGGVLGAVTWKAIDVARLTGEVLLMGAALKIFDQPKALRPKFPVFAMVLLAQTPLALNSQNMVVKAAVPGVAGFTLLLLILDVIRTRAARQEA